MGPALHVRTLQLPQAAMLTHDELIRRRIAIQRASIGIGEELELGGTV
jgi:hypothetical protein